ncbi:TPA: hypothetical protein EYP38_04695 [Candidatus Micrarchaeota archaeon]|nr:hypothetical protein [Candidatus Micrarchaeota archaeon]
MYREQYYYSVPHQTVKKAKQFARLMKKRWMAKVEMKKPRGSAVVVKKGSRPRKVKPRAYYDCEVKDLRKLFDSELLNGALSLQAQKKKKDFDIRPFVKKDIANCLKEDDSRDLKCPLEAMNIVRKAVGLKPLPKDSSSARSRAWT